MRSEELANIVHLLRASEQRADRPALETVEDWRHSYERLAHLAVARTDVPVRATHVGDLRAEWIGAHTGRGPVVLYLHGGGYCIGSLDTHRPMLTHLASALRGRVLAVDYRLAPEHPYPAALDDAVAAYRFVVAAHRPDGVVIAGDSAGGGLVVSTLMAIRDAGLPMPAAGVCLSPWADLTQSGSTIESNAADDPMVRPEDLLRWAGCYAGPVDPGTPAISPVFGDLRELPPLLIEVGTAEVLLDDARRLAERARGAGVEVVLHEEEAGIHVWHFFAGATPEADAGIKRIADFARGRVARRATD